MKASLFLTTLLIAAFAAAGLYLLKDRFAFDFPLLFGANLFLAVVTLLSGFVSSRANPAKAASFVNGVYGGTLLRLFLIGGAAVWVILQKGTIDTRSLLLTGVLYILYTGAETFILQKAARKHKASTAVTD